MDGDAGPCLVEFTAIDGSGAPVQGAEIKVHIEYGFLGLRQLDLQVATNSNGKVRFVGLPDNVDGVLFFEAFTDKLKGVAVDDPTVTCRGNHSIYMGKR